MSTLRDERLTNQILQSKSVVEIQFYLMATPCRACRKGRLNALRQHAEDESSRLRVDVECAGCQDKTTLEFKLDPDAPDSDRNNLYPVVNPTDEPSRLLDVGQWITLFRVVLEAASKESDRIEARRLGYEAAQCLEEALKFYDDNELPPEGAVFTDTTRTRLRDVPQQFSRSHLLAMRAKLPSNTVMQRNIRNQDSDQPQKRPWWQFWRS